MRPQLAAPAPADALDFPLLASAKLDGIRCFIEDGVAKARSGDPIPSKWVQTMFGHPMLNGLDGELTYGAPYADGVFNRTQSAVMAFDGPPGIILHVFDYWNGPPGERYVDRYANLVNAFAIEPYVGHPYLTLLEQVPVLEMDTLVAMQQDHLEAGYEGLILRNPAAPYKNGRSTANPIGAVHATSGKPLQEWGMLKMKKFASGEARIVACNELMQNMNDLDEDALGFAKRSTSAGGMVPGGVLGSLTVTDCESGIEFGIGTGFDALERAELWSQRAALVGKVVRYKHFEIGVKTAPRFPVFLGFRDERDMGAPKQ